MDMRNVAHAFAFLCAEKRCPLQHFPLYFQYLDYWA